MPYGHRHCAWLMPTRPCAHGSLFYYILLHIICLCWVRLFVCFFVCLIARHSSPWKPDIGLAHAQTLFCHPTGSQLGFKRALWRTACEWFYILAPHEYFCHRNHRFLCQENHSCARRTILGPEESSILVLDELFLCQNHSCDRVIIGNPTPGNYPWVIRVHRGIILRWYIARDELSLAFIPKDEISFDNVSISRDEQFSGYSSLEMNHFLAIHP